MLNASILKLIPDKQNQSQSNCNQVALSKIKIPPEMISHLPKTNNLAEKYTYFKYNKKFKSPIVLDKNYTLVNGYITYLLAKMMGYEIIEVEFK
ncbi:hypothetical protein K413DRAFT_4719 [Clostridium sp. ASBs410]|nr:hypothetical protein K413DRAFT_4719 [Clostridium sp. ASBs410]